MIDFLVNLKNSLLTLQTLYLLIKVILIFIACIIASKSVKANSKQIIIHIQKDKRLSKRETEKRANTLVQIINQIAAILIYGIGVFIILAEIGIELASPEVCKFLSRT